MWSGSTSYRAIGIRSQNMVVYYTECWGSLTTTWDGNSVSWYAYVYSGDASNPQMNASNVTYQYLALG